MYFYEVWVGSPKYHSQNALTYSWPDQLPNGTVVTVPLKQASAFAIVVDQATKPSFAVKPMLDIVHETPMPKPLLELVPWLSDYYPAPFGQTVSLLLPPFSARGKAREPTKPSPEKPIELPALTKEQSAA